MTTTMTLQEFEKVQAARQVIAANALKYTEMLCEALSKTSFKSLSSVPSSLLLVVTMQNTGRTALLSTKRAKISTSSPSTLVVSITRS